MMTRRRVASCRRRQAVGAVVLVMVISPVMAGPASAAVVDTGYDVCAALRGGANLATVEAKLEARGYTARNAGRLTGTTIRKRCPDQAAQVIARLKRANG